MVQSKGWLHQSSHTGQWRSFLHGYGNGYCVVISATANMLSKAPSPDVRPRPDECVQRASVQCLDDIASTQLAWD